MNLGSCIMYVVDIKTYVDLVIDGVKDQSSREELQENLLTHDIINFGNAFQGCQIRRIVSPFLERLSLIHI